MNGLTHHKPVVRNDIKLSARLVHALDQKGSLWGEEVHALPHTHTHSDGMIQKRHNAGEVKKMGGDVRATDDLHMMEKKL